MIIKKLINFMVKGKASKTLLLHFYLNRLIGLKASSDLTTVVYEYTLQVQSVKSHFLRTYNSSTYRYEKAISYPRNQPNGSKICTRPGQMSGKRSMCQKFCICSGLSFIAKYSYEREEKTVCQFLTGHSFKERRNLKKFERNS